MKIKENVSSLKLKSLIPAFCFSLVAGLVLRCVQIAKLIEVDTGFYTEKSIITFIFNVIIIVACISFAVISFLSSESKNINTIGMKSKTLFVSAIIFACSLVFDSSYSLSMSKIKIGESYIDSSAFKSLMSSGALPSFIQSIFAVLTALYIVVLAFSYLKGNQKVSKYKILALSPVGWIIFRLIFLFIRKISFVRVSDLFYELIMLGCYAMFFMAFAQVTSNVYKEGFGWRVIGFGLPAGLIAGVLSLSRLVFSLVDSSYINGNHPFRIADLCFALFAFVLCIQIIKNIKNDESVSTEEQTVIEEND